jgi:hypothetical protein
VTGDVPSIRHFHAACVIGSNMYIFGGFGGKNLDDMYTFDFGSYMLHHCFLFALISERSTTSLIRSLGL